MAKTLFPPYTEFKAKLMNLMLKTQ
jgi:hypothetical protein